MQLKVVNVHDALTNNQTARWVVGYEGLYKITYNGMVYSYIKNRFLKPGLSGKNYFTVSLFHKTKYPKPHRSHTVHTLVANAFLPNPDNKRTVNHKNGNKLFNHVTNLEHATNGENNQHAVNTGLRKIKCTPDIISEILSIHIRADKNFGAKALAKKYGVNKCTIHDLLNNHLTNKN